MHISSDQIRAARALLRLEQAELARLAQVSVATMRRIEAAPASVQVNSSVIAGVCQVLEQAGAEFIEGGVRRRSPRHAKAAQLFSDLRAISLHSAGQLHGHDILTDHDLYDDSGLPA